MIASADPMIVSIGAGTVRKFHCDLKEQGGGQRPENQIASLPSRPADKLGVSILSAEVHDHLPMCMTRECSGFVVCTRGGTHRASQWLSMDIAACFPFRLFVMMLPSSRPGPNCSTDAYLARTSPVTRQRRRSCRPAP